MTAPTHTPTHTPARAPSTPRLRRAAGRALAKATAPVAVCALTALAVTLLPGDAGQHRAIPTAATAARPAGETATAKCPTPEASLRPTGDLDGSAVQRIKQRKHLIAGVDQNSYRWGYRDPATGELSGFDIDLVRAIAKDILGDPEKVVFVALSTDNRIPALKQHKVDIIARTMTISCDRIKDVAFSTEYFEGGQVVMVPKGSTVTGFDESLKGMKVCTANGSSARDWVLDHPHGSTLLTVTNQLDCLVRLQLGQVDAVVNDNALAAGQAAQDPTVQLVGKPFTTEPYGVAMNLDDKDLVRRVNKVLEDYRSGGSDSPWMRAYRHWLASDLKGIDAPPEPKYLD
ncbi:glutamate ABC transporter substrate-binding protein [Streptomyces sp. UNOC14_S4]|uniref:glutamate ABC transporter substrate-binding protein n=1 Tax=Streptomyces sp. UNOC14_S4 TaxID=2872340 RepID=UPI001E4F1926|nr:glutamate ABC transporter substrate-binding protein [Streptomyces sp. UNOC14_S4]MCC3768335.1 glutamate ABC transporter substrate-binding protein [Streptomyces sp. UNOC14_S4]